MLFISQVFCVLHQFVIFIRRFINKLVAIPLPQLVFGENTLNKSAEILSAQGCCKPLLVSDKMLTKLGFTDQLADILQNAGMDVAIFDDVTPDPTILLVNQGANRYLTAGCDSVIALGGGSVIDCAKAITASACKNKTIDKLAGLFKVRKTLPTVIAIPTTAGTGSEATLVAVITDPDRQKKFTVVDPCLVPKVAILDPLLMLGLPKAITAQTGMDALTHAIESYIGLHSTKQTKAYGIEAMKRILVNLPKVTSDGNNIEARAEMALASYYAGLAFTRASVGYVHAIAHQLGGIYHIPHGLANAVVLPHVLDYSFDKAYLSYAEIAYQLELAPSEQDKMSAAKAFIAWVKQLAAQLDIPKGFSELQRKDIDSIAKRAVQEAQYEYPVPKQMSVNDCRQILEKLLLSHSD